MSAPSPTPAAAPAQPTVAHALNPWSLRAQWALASITALGLLAMGLHVWLGGLRDARPLDLDHQSTTNTRLDINQADLAQLRQLPEVGERLAERIIDYRRTYGPFRSIDELAYVTGIGRTKLARLKVWVCVDTESLDLADDDRPLSPSSKGKNGSAMAAKQGKGETAPVDLNEATSEQLQRVPGIGPATAARIIETRKKQPFRNVDDLRRVPGIGPKTLEKLRPFLTVKPKGDI
jgi:competence protein ComEA